MKGLMYHMVGDGDSAQITVFVPGREPLQALSSNPSFRAICEAAIAGDEDIEALFDVKEVVARKLTSLSRRVSSSGDKLYLDGEELHGTIVQHVLSMIAVGADEQPLVNFLENMAANPNPRSVEMLYDWLEASDGFTIDADGYIRGYKGVRPSGNGGYESINTGKARVNGVEFVGAIPNNLGDVVEMPRSEVADDPSRGCSTGLHVGTYEYASGWARGALLEVRVNPTDVVSVPTDCGAQKMRCCRYEVVGTIDQKYATPVAGYNPADLGDLWGDGEGDDEPVDSFWLDFLND